MKKIYNEGKSTSCIEQENTDLPVENTGSIPFMRYSYSFQSMGVGTDRYRKAYSASSL